MPHVFEPARSARSKCRGCGLGIAKDEVRFGEGVPNPYGDEGDETTLWFHIACGAYRRPESFLAALTDAADVPAAATALEAAARHVGAHRRLNRVNGAERAPTGRARCRSCRELIAKDAWRIPLVFFEETRFQPSGYVHARCAPEYFETADILDLVRHFAPELDEEAVGDIRSELYPGDE